MSVGRIVPQGLDKTQARGRIRPVGHSWESTDLDYGLRFRAVRKTPERVQRQTAGLKEIENLTFNERLQILGFFSLEKDSLEVI